MSPSSPRKTPNHTSYLAEVPYAFAHRGGAARWPENTLEAFRGAYELGYRHIETDIQRTRDGEIVCFHDLTLERTTDARGALKVRTLAELRELDAGYRFSPDGGRTHPYRGAGCRIPTLREALAIAPDLHLNLEIKQRDPDMVDTLLRFIQDEGCADRVLVASAMQDVGDRFRRARDRAGIRIPTSPGVGGILRFWLGVRSGLSSRMRFDFDALQVPVSHGPLRVVDERFVRAAHEHGIHVHVWTIDDPVEMRRLYELGVDAVMTDRPGRLIEVLREVRAARREESARALNRRNRP